MKNTESDWLQLTLLFIAILMSFGWYSAEQDNEILLQELEAQNYTKPVHHEGKHHD